MGERVKKPRDSKRPSPDELAISSRELNPSLAPQSHPLKEDSQPKNQPSYGGPGYKWRLMKLQRTYEMAEQRGVSVEVVAMERYGSMDAFNEARAERQFVEDRDGSMDRSSSTSIHARGGFRRPGAPPLSTSTSRPTKPTASPSTTKGPSIPRVLPTATKAESASNAPMSVDALNKLEANVLRAELMGRPDAAQLRAELEAAREGQGPADSSERVETVPVVDGFGRLYDIGSSSASDAARPSKRSKVQDEETESLSELVRQEKFSAGRADQKDADAMLAHQIMADQGFENDTDYMDEEAKRFARKRMRDDTMKRQFAVQDFARTKRALDECPFCWQDDGVTPPSATIVSNGTCAYLALPDREPLVDGHCWIVPMQHHVSSLDIDENGWTEIRQSMVFFETVLSLRQQKHTYLEAIPLPNDVFPQVPAYFRQALSEVESEWADHTQVIEFSEARPFQHSMVSRLPYFMIQWDYKGQRGYGHVIESLHGQYTGRRAGPQTDEPTFEDGDHVGGRGFPSYRLDAFRTAWAPFDWTRELTSYPLTFASTTAMVRGPKHHLKHLAAPSSWMLDKLSGTYAPRPSTGPHKLREALPLVILLRNRLKYALTGREVQCITMQRIIKVDNKVRTDPTYPTGFQDVVSIDKSGEHFRILYDVKGRFVVHRITAEEAQFKLLKVKRVQLGAKGVPQIVTHDGRTLRYPDPLVRVNDTVKFDLVNQKMVDFIKFDTGAHVMVTGGRNIGRAGQLIHLERHHGGFDIVHIRDPAGREFSTRLSNIFVIGDSEKRWISMPRGGGVKLTITEERDQRRKRDELAA
ncbi:hypothetical protein MEQU1_002844 [Malassezia equina]|uniref:40S ribosomal protein S4 n=1 Tax=Malassezia equina TaxID=1381935 RepID=A0AAF0ECZ8_9BASI|nr:hypothetical protein MEQU1_002844 [Malassezia equina]